MANASAVSTGISSGFRGASLVGGSRSIGTSQVRSASSSATLASKISSFKTVATPRGPEIPLGSRGLNARDMSIDRAGFKAFKPTNSIKTNSAELKLNALYGPKMTKPNTFGVEKPAVKVMGDVKSFPARGENGSPRSENNNSSTIESHKSHALPDIQKGLNRDNPQRESRARVEQPVIAFQPDRLARGAERFGVPIASTKTKGLERFNNTPYINFVDRTVLPATVKKSQPIMEVRQVATDIVLPKVSESTPATDFPAKAEDKKDHVSSQPDQKPDVVLARQTSNRINADQTRSLLFLMPLVTAGILTRSEAEKKAGIIDQDSEDEEEKKKKAQSKVKNQAITKAEQIDNSAEKTMKISQIEPTLVAPVADDPKNFQELAQLMQVMQAGSIKENINPVILPGQSQNVLLAAERVQKMAEQLQEKLRGSQTTSSKNTEPVAQRLESGLKKIFRVVTKKEKKTEEANTNGEHTKRSWTFQEDVEAEKARIEYAKSVKERIQKRKEAAGLEDTSVSGKELHDELPLTESMRGKALKQKGQERVIEDGTSIASREGYKYIEMVTDENIEQWVKTEGVRPVEFVDEITTTASKAGEVDLTFEQRQTPGGLAITTYGEQIVVIDTLEMTASQRAADPTSIKYETEETTDTSVEEELIKGPQEEIPIINREMEMIRRALNFRTPMSYQRLAVMSK